MIEFLADDQVKLFAANSKKTEDYGSTLPILHICWFQLMHMIGNPASIISFDPRTSGSLPSNILSAMMINGKLNSQMLTNMILSVNW